MRMLLAVWSRATAFHIQHATTALPLEAPKATTTQWRWLWQRCRREKKTCWQSSRNAVTTAWIRAPMPPWKGMRTSRQLQSQAIQIPTITSCEWWGHAPFALHPMEAKATVNKKRKEKEKWWYFNKLACDADKLIFRIKKWEYIFILCCCRMSCQRRTDIKWNSFINPHVVDFTYTQLLDISSLVFGAIRNMVTANSNGYCIRVDAAAASEGSNEKERTYCATFGRLGRKMCYFRIKFVAV